MIFTLDESAARTILGRDLIATWSSLSEQARNRISEGFSAEQLAAARALGLIEQPAELPRAERAVLVPAVVRRSGFSFWASCLVAAYLLVLHLLAALGITLVWLTLRALAGQS